jgi:hypothetical protein
MRSVFILIALAAFSLTSFGQISPALKAGIGYPYILDKDESIGTDFHTISSFPKIAVEKPFPIEIRRENRLSINPGLAYYIFKENEVNGNKTKGKEYKVNHQSINGYIKLLYQAKLAGKTEAFVYFGGIGGFHFITKTKGDKTTYGLNQEMPLVVVEVNENGKDFFDMVYYGAVIGFQPNARKYNFIKPSFELAFYPGFITKTLVEVDNTKKDVSTIQFSVFLGFRIK